MIWPNIPILILTGVLFIVIAYVNKDNEIDYFFLFKKVLNVFGIAFISGGLLFQYIWHSPFALLLIPLIFALGLGYIISHYFTMTRDKRILVLLIFFGLVIIGGWLTIKSFKYFVGSSV